MSNLEPGIEMFAPETILKTDEDISDDGDAATVANVTIKKDVSAKEDELISMETLRESPVQWPERFPGIDEFLTMSDTPIHTPSRDNTQNFTSADMAKINRKLSSGWPQTGFIHCSVFCIILELASLTPEQLIDKIKSMHDEIYQLGVRESKEMTRGKLLGIFDRMAKVKKWISRISHSMPY